jgi:hypothetical protein
MVSTHSGEELFSAKGSRYSVDLRPAFDPMDIAINSGLSLLELRDVMLARAEEEDAPEIALRIPRSVKLRSELIELAHDSEDEPENSNSVPAAKVSRQPSAIRFSYSSSDSSS